MCLKAPWKYASRSVLLECVEGEEYPFFWRGAQQLGDCNGAWTGMDPPAEDQWISALVGADDQLETGLGKEQDISVISTKFVWYGCVCVCVCGLSE